MSSSFYFFSTPYVMHEIVALLMLFSVHEEGMELCTWLQCCTSPCVATPFLHQSLLCYATNTCVSAGLGIVEQQLLGWNPWDLLISKDYDVTCGCSSSFPELSYNLYKLLHKLGEGFSGAVECHNFPRFEHCLGNRLILREQ